MQTVLGAYGQYGSSNITSLDVKYNYEYPMGLDLSPNSALSKKICTEVMARARLSYEKMSARHSSWNQIDRVLTAYVPLDVMEKQVKAKDARKPVSIVVPYAYATLETLLTYLVSTFLSGTIFQYDGTGPEDLVGAALLEKVIDQQCNRAKVALNLHTLFRDSLAYSIGASACSWEKKTGKRTVPKEQGFFSFLGNFVKTGMKNASVETIMYEGNKLKNIDPYCYLPDPSVSVHAVQDGEFIGWFERTSILSLLSSESTSEDVFNVRYLKHLNAKSSLISQDNSKRNERFNTSTGREESSSIKTPADVIYMYCTIIPKDWGLGDAEYPEKWYFAISGDHVVIECRPIGLNHNLYPIGVASPDFDGYSASPVSRIEMMYGLQETLDWLFSSHIANVRKAINDMLIVDPYLLNMQDLESPEPGKIIRLRRAGWGKGVEGAVKQLAVQDVTRGNIADSNYIIELMNRCSASNDSLQGITRKTSERITATEIQSDRSSTLSRLERMAKVISMQAMYDISYLFAAHTQQLMTQDTYVKVVGDWPELLQGIQTPDNRIPVSPTDLMVGYDVKLKDAMDKSGGNGQEWVSLYQILAQNPMLGQQFDMVRIFKHIAVLMGASDVNNFVAQGGNIQQSMVPDQTVLDEAQKGNLVPIQQGM
jgi:hypothetical protein